MLESYQDININPHNIEIQIGVDEAGRGNLFGPIFSSAVIFPSLDTFSQESINIINQINDSKKLSINKLMQLSSFIKKNALAWSVNSCDNSIIDEIGISNANFNSMHKCLNQIYSVIKFDRILVDGSNFKPFVPPINIVRKISVFSDPISIPGSFNQLIPHICIPQGDGKYLSIASASILAKEAQITYINELCDQYPLLHEQYKLRSNNGYGTALHCKGIREFGYTKWHRKSFQIKSFQNIDIQNSIDFI